MTSLSEIISQIKEAVKVAENTPSNPEGKLRELVSPIWVKFLKEKRIGLNLQIRDELVLANGRADTVFNKLILEYKKPHTIKLNNEKNRKLISQVEGYILDLAKKERFSRERLLGVAFDGSYFIFMRYVKRWIHEEPMPVSEDSLDFFLKNLEKLTSKAALIPENLIRDFAVGRESRNKVAVDCIKAFYNEVYQHGSEEETKEHVFFEQWKVQFAEVHGSLEQKKIDKKTLFTSYGFSKKEQKDFNVHAFFFALDSYYAVLMKLLSYQVVGYYTLKGLTGLPLRDWETLDSDSLKRKCDELEEGGIFRSIGIRNFLEGDLFSWYTQAWNKDIYQAIRQIINHLNDYDPETMEIAPDETRDILKRLYQHLVPKKIRHDLGEYYTPDWLAERCLNQLNYNGDPKLRILDPGCGSGTFLILAIKRAKEFALKKKLDDGETLKKILHNIQGFDLNPLAVISARTNYMMAIADLLQNKKGEITLPVYLCDSINPPQARKAHEATLFEEKVPYEVKTSVGNFLFSNSIVSKQRIQVLANIMEDSVKSNTRTKDFLDKVKRNLHLSDEEYEESEIYLEETYAKLIDLEGRGINGIWARIIKNAFAPLFVGRYDLIVGNPPWVTWMSLPNEYRSSISNLWGKYDLFQHKGLKARLGSSGDDISILMTYVSIDDYLIENGKLCFVITQSLFKSAGGGEGFRRFRLGEKGVPIKVIQVDDMTELQPFEGATNRTAILALQKNNVTQYPVSYCLWKKNKMGRIPTDATFEEIFNITSRVYMKAQSINNKSQGPWITAKAKALKAYEKVSGKSFYKARKGISTSANGVYWVKILKKEDDAITIENLYNIGKKDIQYISCQVEKELIYPLIRGRDVSRWYCQPSAYIIHAQNPNNPSKAYPEKELAELYPKGLDYFNSHKETLESRKDYIKFFKPSNEPFYSLYNFGPYTLSKYKVLWKYIDSSFRTAVISPVNDTYLGENIIPMPDSKLVIVDTDNEEEAHYVCALLNSSISRFTVLSYTVSTQLSTHILDNLSIPEFDENNDLHLGLSELSRSCHEKAHNGLPLYDEEEKLDIMAASIWRINDDELKDIKDNLSILE